MRKLIAYHHKLYMQFISDMHEKCLSLGIIWGIYVNRHAKSRLFSLNFTSKSYVFDSAIPIVLGMDRCFISV